MRRQGDNPILETALARLCAHQPLTQAQATANVQQWWAVRRRRNRRNALIALAWVVLITLGALAVLREDPAWILVALVGGALVGIVPIGYQLSMSTWDDDPMAVLGLYECTAADMRRIQEVCDRSPQARTIVRQWLASGQVLRTRELVQLIQFDHALDAHELATAHVPPLPEPMVMGG